MSALSKYNERRGGLALESHILNVFPPTENKGIMMIL